VNDTSKLLLTVVIGGTILGLGLSRTISPTMNLPSTADWRDRYRSSYSDASMQFVDAGPIDSTPAWGWPGARFGLYHAPDPVQPVDPRQYQTEYEAAEYETADYAVLPDVADDPIIARSAPPASPFATAAKLPPETLPAGQEAGSEPVASASPAASGITAPDSTEFAQPSPNSEVMTAL
jgi:hypothetical protein